MTGGPGSGPRAPQRVVLGPTAVGKTAVALEVAGILDAEIISVDARQIYRGMEIGSAAPTPSERARVPHHLVAEVDPTETMTAGEFGRRARATEADVLGRGRIPLFVGGSGLYLRAALGGLDEKLPRDPGLRARLRERLRREGAEALHRELTARDPETAARVSSRDAQRLTRALEIIHLTGRPASALRTRGRSAERDARILVLDRARHDLEARIRSRVAAMVAAGLAAEVQALLDLGVSPDRPALKSVGYAETLRHLSGELDRNAWIEAITIGTRRLAKRQRTWFRGLEGAVWLTVAPGEPPATTATRVLEGFEAE